MPTCRECGKPNPEGTTFCGSCGKSLAGDHKAPLSKAAQPASVGTPRQARSSRLSQPVFRPPLQSPPLSSGRRGIERIPPSALGSSHLLGRAIAALAVVIVLLVLTRGLLTLLSSGGGAPATGQPAAQSQNTALTDADRKNGVVSLCKVFQIYGVPKDDREAISAARNATELFKLAGNQTTDGSLYILDTLAREFSSGKLKGQDCTTAGEPLPTTPTSESGTDAAP